MSRALFDPVTLCERLAATARQRRRLRKLRGTVARHLSAGHIDSLELIEIAATGGISAIYDIGASTGTWTLLAKAICPRATIDAFEPLEQHQREFRSNVGGIDGISLHPFALGARASVRPMRVTNLPDASSVLPIADASRAHFGLSEEKAVNVRICALDTYRVQHGLPFPDLLKLDVQGYELEVLKGATATLPAAKAIIIEVSFIEYYRGQVLFHEIVEFLAGQGLFVAALGSQTPRARTLGQADVLFLREVPL